MKKSYVLAAAGLACVAGLASAQEVGRVITSTPVIQQVAVQNQVCGAPAARQPSSGGGAALGALIGAVVGNTFSSGAGAGRAAATGLGAVAGAVLGDSIEGQNRAAQAQPQCTTQTSYENRTVGYNVTYEYAGRHYTVQMPQDPGPTVRLQVTPIGSATESAPVQGYSGVQPAAAPAVTSQVVVPATYVQPVVAVPVAYPGYYYAAPYYPPVALSLNLGYSRGYYSGGGYRHGGHWR